MNSVLDKFFISLGFKVDTKGAEAMQARTASLKTMMLGLGAAVAGVAYGLGKLVKSAATEMDVIADFAEIHGVSARSVEALGLFAEENDSSMSAMQSTMVSLTATTGEAAKGMGRGVTLFKQLGLSAKDATGKTKDFRTIFGDVVDLMNRSSGAEQQAIARRLGIDPKMLPTLRKGRAEVERMLAEAEASVPFTEDQYQTANRLDQLLVNTRRQIKWVGQQIGVALMPAVEKTVHGFLNWWKAANKATGPGQRTLLQQLTDAAMSFYHTVERIGRSMVWLYKKTNENRAAMLALKTALGWLMWLRVAPWFLAIGAAIKGAALAAGGLTAAIKGLLLKAAGLAIFALLAEDLYQFHTGGESLLGFMEEQFPGAVNVATMATVFLGLALMGVSAKIGLIVAGVIGWVEAVKELRDNWKPITEWVSGQAAAYEERTKGSLMGRRGISWTDGGPTKSEPKFSLSAMPPMYGGAMTRGTAVSNTTQISGTTINVNGAGDPKAVAREVDARLRAQVRNSQPGYGP